MTDEVRFALQLGLNLLAILVAGWLAGHYAARRMQKVLEAERKRDKQARQQARAEVMADMPPIPPEVEQLIEVERWVLTARDLQILLTSLCTLVRIRLGADPSTQRGVSSEINRSLKSLGRQENKWLDDSLAVVAYVRQLDPAKGKALDQTLETCISRLNHVYLQAAQSGRRAASLCEADDDQKYGDAMANAYLTEADQAAAKMASTIASALDRVAYIKEQLRGHQAQQITAAAAERTPDPYLVLEYDEMEDGSHRPR
jgi:hypothetical protein